MKGTGAWTPSGLLLSENMMLLSNARARSPLLTIHTSSSNSDSNCYSISINSSNGNRSRKNYNGDGIGSSVGWPLNHGNTTTSPHRKIPMSLLPTPTTPLKRQSKWTFHDHPADSPLTQSHLPFITDTLLQTSMHPMCRPVMGETVLWSLATWPPPNQPKLSSVATA